MVSAWRGSAFGGKRRVVLSELIAAVQAGNPHLPRRAVEAAVRLLIAQLADALARGERVELRRFGVFSVANLPARAVHDPRTGKALGKRPGRAVRFRPAAGLANAVDGRPRPSRHDG